MNAFESEIVPEAPGRPGPGRPGKRREQRLDAIDRTIVQALRANARISFTDLARTVGLSAPSVADRVKRLEQGGLITGYHAEVAAHALRPGVVALVGVEQASDGDQDEIGVALEQLPEIEDCYLVAGDDVFVLKVRVPDMPTLELTLAALRRIAGVARTHTTVVLSSKWEGRGDDLLLDLPAGPSSDAAVEGGGLVP